MPIDDWFIILVSIIKIGNLHYPCFWFPCFTHALLFSLYVVVVVVVMFDNMVICFWMEDVIFPKKLDMPIYNLLNFFS